MTLSFVPVKTIDDQQLLARIAGEIWRGYWPCIIGKEQTEYMIEKFQSFDALRKYMAKEDYEYWLLVATEDVDGITERNIVGFTGGRNEFSTDRFFISKVYLYPEARGHGYARRVIEFYEDLCFARGLEAMYLTVNKHNDLGIRAYEGTGFKTIDSVETDIGHGFVMDDFVMEKRF